MSKVVRTLDLEKIRWINLFKQVCKVEPKFCFSYNSAIVFVLDNRYIGKAIGPAGRNTKRLSHLLKRNIKIISLPTNKEAESIKQFIEQIIWPIKSKKILVEKEGKKIIIFASSTSKAALTGKNKQKLEKLKEILKDFFKTEELIISRVK